MLASQTSLLIAREIFRILVVDDDPLAIEFMKLAIRRNGIEVYGATSGAAALDSAKHIRPDLVFLDLHLPDISGMDVLERMRNFDNSIAIVLLTADPSTDSVVQAIQKGAYDYITKPAAVDHLNEKIHKLISDAHIRRPLGNSDEEMLSALRSNGIVGRSPAILEIYSKMRRVAPYFQTVLVTGETGTGKEHVAHALHTLSKMPGPFVSCNCAAIVETLFESELFGHLRGAFTGATQDKACLIEHANGGTLFLDEVGELPLVLQAKLLRVLQNREVQRVGSVSARKVDVRVVAATNRDLRVMVAAKQFREDLFYRLSMIEIHLPSLIDRPGDVLELQRHFLQSYASRYGKPVPRVTRRAQSLIARHRWRGNIRELENVMGYCSMVCEGGVIDVSDFPQWMQKSGENPAEVDENRMSMHEMQKQHATRVLQNCNGNRVRAAGILGISRATLYRLLAETPQTVSELQN